MQWGFQTMGYTGVRKDFIFQKEEFIEWADLYLNTEFYISEFNDEKILKLEFDDFTEGFFFLKSSSVNILACLADQKYWYLEYAPYKHILMMC